jgi:hypothetical protein
MGAAESSAKLASSVHDFTVKVPGSSLTPFFSMAWIFLPIMSRIHAELQTKIISNFFQWMQSKTSMKKRNKHPNIWVSFQNSAI